MPRVVQVIISAAVTIGLSGCGILYPKKIYSGKLYPLNMEKNIPGNTIGYEVPKHLGGERWVSFYGSNGLADSYDFIDAPYTVVGNELCFPDEQSGRKYCSHFFVDDNGSPFWKNLNGEYIYVRSIEKGDVHKVKQSYLRAQERMARRRRQDSESPGFYSPPEEKRRCTERRWIENQNSYITVEVPC